MPDAIPKNPKAWGCEFHGENAVLATWHGLASCQDDAIQRARTFAEAVWTIKVAREADDLRSARGGAD